ncbi:MAG: isochorismate synthase, partial [Leptolyngbyaceae cyanobacterium bins.59]|nr:isochorismate synthase [Leptolyngbyaceae cyanobacterium bins.59]
AVINPVDPLAVLQSISKDQLHFYFERSHHPILQSEADRVSIAAIGDAIQFQVNGEQRFFLAQQFVNSCLKDMVVAGDDNLPFAGPHFFGSFTFFPQATDPTSPFSATTLFLPRWQICRQNDRSILVANRVIDATQNLESLVRELEEGSQAICAIGSLLPPRRIYRSPLFHQQDIRDESHFKSAVQTVLTSIQNQDLDKVVLAHALDVTAPLPFDLIASLHNLRQFYPDCYIFSTGNGRGQHFMGASPERLLSVHDRELVVDALAGSAPRGRTHTHDVELAKRLISSDKERREHRAVSDFICHCLTRLGFTPQCAAIPHLLRLSNIQHLRTVIRSETIASIHPLEIVAALHPTPAVAGVSRDLACQHIRQSEGFDRALYASPLGWLDHRGNCEFIVGIRSALLDGCHARLYAGAGIVAGSDADRELAEVRLKLQTLLAALV